MSVGDGRNAAGRGKVVLLQAELGHPDQAVHVAGGLFKSDLEKAGFAVEAHLLPAAGAAQAAAAIPDASLYLLDSVFPLRHARAVQLEVADRAVVCVGGPNAVQHLLRATVPLIVDGPGRQAVLALAELVARTVAGGEGPMPAAAQLDSIPNLLFADPHDTGSPQPANLQQLPGGIATYKASSNMAVGRPEVELLPFEPDLRWRHPDPRRDPEAWRNAPSVVAAFGCVYNPRIKDYSAPSLPAHLHTSAVAHLTTRYLQRAAGCSFCSFRYQEHRVLPRAESMDVLTEQLRFYRDHLGPTAVSLQTEDPFDVLEPLIDWLGAEWGGPVELRIRSLVKVIMAKEAVLRHCIQRAAASGVRLVLQQVGFESFSDRDLALFHKGVSAEQNRRCADLLSELSYGPAFEGRRGHGLILVHPWTRPADLRDNLNAVREHAPWLMGRLGPEQRLELYADLHPIAVRAEREGLIDRDEGRADFGLAWRFAHDETERFVALWRQIDAELSQGLSRVRAQAGGRPGWAARLRALGEARRAELLELLLDAWEGAEPAAAEQSIRDRVLRDLQQT